MSPHAIAWSIGGAIYRASRGMPNEDMWDVRARCALPHENIWHYEAAPGRTKKEVLALFDRALKD